ncbi:MAG: DUF4301 family protein [Muribaculaceae bacterium]|nr:DUF4301 family protein [Muribaculaceae bacterium]
MITEHDKQMLRQKGITQQQVEEQLHRFETGFPFLGLEGAAHPGNGILTLDEEEMEQAKARWNAYLSDGGHVTKFVPASGAASRMFKALFSFVDGDNDVPAEGSDVDVLIKNIDKLAFFGELDETVRKLYGKGVRQLLDDGEARKVIGAIILPEGLNYGNLPKGLLTFHAYPQSGVTRTPLEEQMVEGVQTATTVDGHVNLHFTVSGNHRQLFIDKIAAVVPALEKEKGVKINVSLSEQMPSTDTIAVNSDNTPFRDNGELVFRPGGHGALIRNLNDIDSEVVFIKNIDNVVPDNFRDATITYKKVIAGVLVQVHDRIALYMDMLEKGNYTSADLDRMVHFLNSTLCVKEERLGDMDQTELAIYLKGKFNRPIRVCGMVRNEGEPGGGPYIARNPDGSFSPQILESSQIDTTNEKYVEMMKSATHFNPVDLVCYIRDYKGNKFDLTEFVDHDTGFISSKSLHGRDLKALELPGLWNGAMSNWNTLFVEVPIATFNPVKTVNDLLRSSHQG